MFPSLTTSSGTEGPLVIEAEIGGHMIHRMYVDGGSSMEVLYEHCFYRLRSEIKNQMFPATTSLTNFSGETIWLICTDIAKITRKPDKHGHMNGRAHKEPGECYQSIIQAPSNDVAQENITQGLSLVNPPQE
ncbi:hypothetical protein Tco_1465620 [Tanacetum coccineum]